MGIPVIIYGKSGSGKSRSLKNFAEDEILHVNVEQKELPFKKKFKYTLRTDNVSLICSKLTKMPLKTAVIDDAGYIMTNKFMRGHSGGRKGSAVYDLYNDIGDSFWSLFEHIKGLPHDVIVYIIMHEEYNDSGELKLKTIGKLLDNSVCIEGMVTICIRCVNLKGKHMFQVHSADGSDITKTPEDMFQYDEIENDLKAVDTVIREYYDILPTTAETADENNNLEKE